MLELLFWLAGSLGSLIEADEDPNIPEAPEARTRNTPWG